jgi:alanyl-tRNA synthetase
METPQKQYVSPVTSSEIRNAFCDFFISKNHVSYESSSLIPHDDQSLLFTNAGMVQFKNVLRGTSQAKDSRVTTCQQCVRAGGKHNDIDNVGNTNRHHTFFEMLGNFSFGDYFKKEAIEMAWEFITVKLKLNSENLWVTTYTDDEEAINLWLQISGLPRDRIVQLQENFWAGGDTGPCGYCSEIFFDKGDEYAGCPPGQGDEGDRFVEIWNLVFIELNRESDGVMVPLPKKNIDTGMGLERVTAIMQNQPSAYETDLFNSIINQLSTITGCNYNEYRSAFRIIADHLRSSSFLISQGVVPSNDKQGYVLRKIMRRAFNEANKLQRISSKYQNHEICIFTQLYEQLIQTLPLYFDLKTRKAHVISVFQEEYDKFQEVIKHGEQTIEEYINKRGAFDEKDASILYETHGVPFEITQIMLLNRGIELSQEKFNEEYKKHKDKAKNTWVHTVSFAEEIKKIDITKCTQTEFIGYEHTECDGKLIACHTLQLQEEDVVEFARLSSDGLSKRLCAIAMIFDKTPFYATSGGQIHDMGTITFIDKEKIQHNLFVTNVEKCSNIFVHKVLGYDEDFSVLFQHNDSNNNSFNVVPCGTITLSIDKANRNKIAANHSATHLLHMALRKILGESVLQKGSLVEAGRLRLDFQHNASLTQEETLRLEHFVNNEIMKNTSRNRESKHATEAFADGAIGLFEQKYQNQEKVFVITMGESKELCGGTHVNSTGDIGLFKITSQSSVASGIRRIEAITGIKAYEHTIQTQLVVDDLCIALNEQPESLVIKITELMSELKERRKNVTFAEHILKNEQSSGKLDNSYIKILSAVTQDISSSDMRSIMNKKKPSNSIVILLNLSAEKFNLMVSVDNINILNVSAKQLLESVFNKSGGNDALAQAGGTLQDLNTLVASLEKANIKAQLIKTPNTTLQLIVDTLEKHLTKKQ